MRHRQPQRHAQRGLHDAGAPRHATDAERIQNAWLATLEDGIHTGDIYREGVSVERVPAPRSSPMR
jgi:hypothetical protein